MLDQVTRTSREYPVLPSTTEDQGVLWYMSRVLLTAFGFFYVATPFRPPFHHEGREHILQDAFTRQRSLVRSQHRPLIKTLFCRENVSARRDVGTYTRPFLHQSDNHGPYDG
jgi:hypothetical protein